MPVLSPTGEEHARSINADLTHATRDDFAHRRGHIEAGISSNEKRVLIAKEVGREIVEANLTSEYPDPPEHNPAQNGKLIESKKNAAITKTSFIKQ